MVQNVILIEQTMDAFSTPRYWEGIMGVRAGDLSGEQIGTAYMELTGCAPMPDQ